MSKKVKKSNVAVFVEHNRKLVSQVVRQFQAVQSQEAAYRTSIAELGKSLIHLRDLCKREHVSWQKVAADHVHIPIRSANRYIALADKVNNMSAGVVAKVSAAGFDAGSARIQRRVKAISSTKLAKMGAVELAQALRKRGSSRKTPRAPEQRFKETIKTAIASYLHSVINTNVTREKALETVQEHLDTFKVRTNGLHLVAKAA